MGVSGHQILVNETLVLSLHYFRRYLFSLFFNFVESIQQPVGVKCT